MKDISILVLDDEKVFRNEIKEFLDGEGFTVLTAERPSEAFGILS